MKEGRLRNTLKVQRAMRDLTQADLAALAGVTRKSVNAIENVVKVAAGSRHTMIVEYHAESV